MRGRLACVLCIILLLTGCKGANSGVDRAIALRNKLAESNGCSFHAKITADYGEKIYVFSMDCTTDKEGNLTFSVTEPATISGITGKISTSGGEITFDDKVLAFQMMADGQITPVSAPWLFIKTLRSGYLKGCTDEENGYQISIDDSYAEDALHLNILVEGNTPKFGEIFWKNRRVLTVSVENFTYL